MQEVLNLLKFAEQPITTALLLDAFENYASPYDKIDSLVKKKFLIQIKRGLYILGDALTTNKPEPFTISNHLYGPSYISLESALFFWGLIPEKVYTHTAMTTKRTESFQTPIGKFEYFHLPTPYYSLGISSITLKKNQNILIASPEKSLIDKIIHTSNINLRSKKQTRDLLIEDLRIDKESLKNLDAQKIIEWLPFCPKKTSLMQTYQTLKSL